MNRKDFISTVLGAALAPAMNDAMAMGLPNQKVDRLTDEPFWTKIRNEFVLDRNFIDLRASGASSIPRVSMNKFLSDFQYVQSFPSDRSAPTTEASMERLRGKLAGQINCLAKEIAVVRNTTEALNNAIMGFPFQKGDEVVASVHEYDSMMGSFYQRKIRDGIVIKNLEIPYKISNTKEILKLWEQSITPKTKAFLISQIVWISGQIYPVKEICELARKHDIVTIVDAAHSFSHLKIDVKDLGCDYLGTSLHKWCAAPIGTGFLYIKRDLIAKTFPLFAHYVHKPDEDAIEKFDNLGTITPIFDAAIASIDFWDNLGFELKTKRMHYLKRYWTTRLKQNPKIEIVTDTDEKFSCGLAFFKINGKSSTAVKNVLWKEHRIKVAAIENYKNHYVDYAGVNAIGVATPVYITTKELDRFIQAIERIV
jgi:selenocysteine lyase/cysteine desulfurase